VERKECKECGIEKIKRNVKECIETEASLPEGINE
jgi:hypothetical protein